jgi:hypothetical protein
MIGRRYDGSIRFNKLAVTIAPTVATSEYAGKKPLIQKSLSRVDADGRAITTPLPGQRLITQTGPNWVVCDVTAGGQQIGVAAHQLSHKPISKQMRASPVIRVESLRVTAVKLLHRSGKARVRGYYDQVVMVVHQAVRKAWKSITLDRLLKPLQKELPILIEAKYRSPIAPARGDVIDAIGKEYAARATHFDSLQSAFGRE